MSESIEAGRCGGEPPLAIVRAAGMVAAMFPGNENGDTAYGTCEDVSAELAASVSDAELVYLLGCTTHFPDRIEDYLDHPSPDPEMCHAAVRIGDWYVDLSRRQFDPTCEHPYIRHADEFEREWVQITTTVQDISDENLNEVMARMQTILAEPGGTRIEHPPIECS